LQSPPPQSLRFLRLLDLALVITAIFMVITDETVLLFHVIFVLLSVGAFYWPFRGFVLRAVGWVTIDALYVLHAVSVGKTQVDELIEIPLMTVILSTVFLIAQQRSKAELQARNLNAELNQRVQELNTANTELSESTEKLQQTQAQLILEEKMSALGRLVAGIAHEINTPLGAIQASAGNINKALEESFEYLPQLLQRLGTEQQADFFNLLNEAMQSKNFITYSEKRAFKKTLGVQLEEQGITNVKHIADQLIDIGIYKDIQPFLPLLKHPNIDWILQLAYNLTRLQSNNRTTINAVERASKVVFALKSYARFGGTHPAGNRSGDRHLAQITEGLETVLELYRNQIKQGIEVVRDYKTIPPIWCYPDELIQVWTNLIHNAIQSMANQGTLAIATFQQDNCVVVQVRDSGCGIPPEIQGRIFEPFFTTKPIGEGSGLGLDICRKILDKHQGRIEVASHPGQTTFSVWLPIDDLPTDIKQDRPLKT
jgi:signal transduction histidine kinase